MATETSPSMGCASKTPSPANTSHSQVDGVAEHEENAAWRLAHKAIPPSTRIHAALMSPVFVNVDPEDWPPAASSGTIEGGSETGSHSHQASVYQHDVPSRPPPPSSIHRLDSPQAKPPVVSSPTSLHSPKCSLSMHRRRSENSLTQSTAESEYDHMEQVPRLQYHHQSNLHQNTPKHGPTSSKTYPPLSDPVEADATFGRHLTPNPHYSRRISPHRPASAYSDKGPYQRSPATPGSPSWGGRSPSAQSGRSFDTRPLSYVDLTEVSYPQPPPPPISWDNSQLRSVVGSNASLLSSQKTLEMYRKNVKKLNNDSESQYAFAMFLIQHAQEAGLTHDGLNPDGAQKTCKASTKLGQDLENPHMDSTPPDPYELLREAKVILQRLSDRGCPFAQYYLGDGYATGFFNKGIKDLDRAFHLFVSASKHGHAESGYRAALCYEFAWGTKKDAAKALNFYRGAAAKNHPGAMTRLGRACLSGDLGLTAYREGLKWLRRATDSADPQYNAAPYHLGLLYVDGFGADVFRDESYAAQLFTTAADLGHAEASYMLGDAYEHGRLGCPRDPALSVHFYTNAAQQGTHAAAMMALCAWYMVGAEPVLPRDENEAYEWARQAAQLGLAKAEYALAYFTEMGIGCRRDPLEANVWYVKAADSGDDRATHRLAAIRAAASGDAPMDAAPQRGERLTKGGGEKGEKDEKECLVM